MTTDKDKQVLEIMKFVQIFRNAFTKCFLKYQKRERLYGESWRTCNITFLEERLLREIEEYKESKSRDELVDIANLCFMIIERREKN